MSAAPSKPADALSSTTRWCVMYLVAGKEHQSAWFSCRHRAVQALQILQARHGRAFICRD